ncbi:MAG: hypothetical protein U9Q30_00245 [Campylobacterota bacterium]|nr:hypothetical protein [Campylobacterota bacterium]
MDYKSFMLFEVVISLFILSIVFITISKIFVKDSNLDRYKTLQNMQNEFIVLGQVTNTDKIILKKGL